MGILILLTPLGLLAEGAAWGEWAAEELNEMLGFVPAGIESAGQWWAAFFPDYSIPFLGEGRIGETIGYMLSAFIGSLLAYGLTLLLMKRMTFRSNKRAHTNK